MDSPNHQNFEALMVNTYLMSFVSYLQPLLLLDFHFDLFNHHPSMGGGIELNSPSSPLIIGRNL